MSHHLYVTLDADKMASLYLTGHRGNVGWQAYIGASSDGVVTYLSAEQAASIAAAFSRLAVDICEREVAGEGTGSDAPVGCTGKSPAAQVARQGLTSGPLPHTVSGRSGERVDAAAGYRVVPGCPRVDDVDAAVRPRRSAGPVGSSPQDPAGPGTIGGVA